MIQVIFRIVGVHELGLIVLLVGCNSAYQGETSMERKVKTSPNSELLGEVEEAGLWFHAKKTRPIWAKRLEQDETVETLEGEEQVPAGNYLCRGEAGDIWPQTEERLRAKYVMMAEVDEQGWRRWQPKSDAAGVMATQIPHPFEVHAEWGLLSGKKDDFLLKNYEDRDNEAPTDVWIVDQELFEATYERVQR